MSAFKLSDPGASLASDPTLSEYLRCYEFPLPPDVRYGYLRFQSSQARDRVGLFGQAWVPYHPVGTILLIHGYSEHTGNYAELVRDFVGARFAVAALDLRGQGLSEGARGHLESPTAYVEDVEDFLKEIFPLLLPSHPLFIWGHSLGALVGLQLLLRGKIPARPHAAVFTSAFLGFRELTGGQKFLAQLAPLLAKLLPSLPVAHKIPPTVLSHDESYLARRLEDPLISRVATPLWLMSAGKAIQEVRANVGQFQRLSPTLFMLAGDERVTNLTDARKFAFEAYASLRHKVIEFPNYLHELEKEPAVRPRVLSETLAWFRSHI